MKRVRNWLIVLVCMAVCQLAWAQGLNISTSSTIPSQVPMDTTLNINIGITNNNPFAYYGRIGFGYKIDTNSIRTTSDTASGLEYTVNPGTDTINSGQTIYKSIDVHVKLPAFKTGPSVVVIWPIHVSGPPFLANDTLKFTIVVAEPLGTNRIEPEQAKVFIWNKSLRIQPRPQIQLKQVRIYDIQGRQIANYPNPSNDIPLPDNANAMYIAEIFFDNNKRQVFRFYQ